MIDTRSPEAFAGAHIPGSINIWMEGLPAFGGWFADENTRIFLVVESPEATESAVKSLARIGIDTVEGVLTSGVETWREQGLPIEMIAHNERVQTQPRGCSRVLFTCSTCGINTNGTKSTFPAQFTSSSAISKASLPQIPKDAELIVHCSVGHRSGIAVSILKRAWLHAPVQHAGRHYGVGGIGFPIETPGAAKEN